MPTPLNYKTFFGEDEEEQKYWGKEGAGAIFMAKDTGRILLAKRHTQPPEPGEPPPKEPGTWGTWGGKVDSYETPEETVEREIQEETGYDGKYTLTHLWTFRDGEFQYHNYLIMVPFEFTPSINWENEDSRWVDYGNWPSPLHFGLKALIRHAGSKIKHVSDLIKVKNRKNKLFELWESKQGKGLKKVQLMKEGLNNVIISKLGLVDDGMWGYEMKSPHSYIRYTYEPDTKIFYLDSIATPLPEEQNKGYAKALLETFFQLIKQYGGALDIGPYTTSGESFIKHVVERLSKQYNVRLVKGRDRYD